MKVNPNYININVEIQINDENSVLYFYKKMIKIRKSDDIYIYGKYDLLLEENKQIYAYTRTLNDNKVIILCNISDICADCNLDGFNLDYNNLILSNYNVENHINTNNINLNPYECRMYKIK